jgi:ABC-type Zn uptake system ZnuABC Zn-binding protein ZnuA
MSTLIQNASVDTSNIVELGSIVNPLLSSGDDDSAFDPHFWMDPLRVKTAVSEITSQLGAQDTTHVSTYKTNQASYNQKLEDLHLWSQEQLRDIPVARKTLITSHDSLRYFAQRYRFNVIGTVIQGTSTEREPTPSELANLADTITEQKVNAIFSETTVSPQLANMLAQETGARVFELYSGSLGPKGSSADTYLGMMRADVSTIAEALK